MDYYTVTKQIDQSIDLFLLSEKEQNLWEKTIRDHLITLIPNRDEEDIAIATLYLLLFRIKTKRLRDPETISFEYELVKKNFLDEERRYHKKIREAKQGKEKKLLLTQLLYFYKLVEFYLAYLSKTLRMFDFEEIAQEVSLDKMHFLQKHQLLEGNIKKFFVYTRLSFSLFLRKYIFLYALLSGIGIVLFWHGLWGMSDWIIHQFNAQHHFTPFLITAVLGALILYSLGLFLDQTIGDKNSLQNIEDMEMEELDELKVIEKAVKKKMKHN